MCLIQQRTTCYTTHSNIYLYMEYPSHDESRDQMDAIILIYIYIYIRVYTRFGQQRSIGGIRKYFRKSHQKSHASTNPPYYYHNYDDISINISVRTCLRATHSFDQMHGYAQCKYIHIIETIYSISMYIYSKSCWTETSNCYYCAIECMQKNTCTAYALYVCTCVIIECK